MGSFKRSFLALSLVLASFSHTYAANIDEIVDTQFSDYEEMYHGDATEQSLFEWYLQDEGLGSIVISSEVGDYEFAKMVFEEKVKRWWLQYSENEKDEAIRKYWRLYRRGRKLAVDISASAANNPCTLLTKVYADETHFPVLNDASMEEAFRRGFKSYRPDCFIANILSSVKTFDSIVRTMDQKVFDLQKKLRLYRPDELAIEKIYKSIETQLTTAIKDQAAITAKGLTHALEIPASDVSRLQDSAVSLAEYIDCSNLQSETGRKFLCDVRILPGIQSLDTEEALAVLFENKELGSFQPRIIFADLVRATMTYVRTVRPDDQFALFLLEDLETTLTNISEAQVKRVNDTLDVFEFDMEEKLRILALDQRNLWRSYFPVKETEAFIDMLYSLKKSMDMFELYEMGTLIEQNYLEELKSRYNSLVAHAGSIEFSLSLPAREIKIKLQNPENQLVTIPFSVPAIPKGYFFGSSADDASFWVNELSL